MTTSAEMCLYSLKAGIPSNTLLQAPKKTASEKYANQFKLKEFSIRRGETNSIVFITEKIKNSTRDRYKVIAMKVKPIHEPFELRDSAYREVRILCQLKILNDEKKCYNFVYLEDFSKASGPLDLFNDMIPISIRYTKMYMLYLLKYSQKDLSNYRNNISIAMLKTVIFQVLYALYVAQKEFNFVHNDLHVKNVLVNEEPTTCVYRDHEDLWFTQNYSVQIADFDHSRILLQSGEMVYNHKDSFHQAFIYDTDLKKISMELKRLKINDWGEKVEREKNLYKEFRRHLSNGYSIAKLLRHPFFDDLKVKPRNLTQLISYASTDGNELKTRKMVENLQPIELRNEASFNVVMLIAKWKDIRIPCESFRDETPNRTISFPERFTINSPLSSKKRKRRMRPLLIPNKVHKPIERRVITDLFKGMHFVLTGFDPENFENWETQLDKKSKTYELCKLIVSNGGRIIESIAHMSSLKSMVQDSFPSQILLAEQPQRNAKYLNSLALGIPCLHWIWVHHCSLKNRLLLFDRYLLPRGFSIEQNAYVLANKQEMNENIDIFQHKKIELHANIEQNLEDQETKEFKKKKFAAERHEWTFALKNAGAKVVQRLHDLHEQSIDYIVCLGPPEPYAVHLALLIGRKRPTSPMYIVSLNWAIECIIRREILPPLSHEAFHYEKTGHSFHMLQIELSLESKPSYALELSEEQDINNGDEEEISVCENNEEEIENSTDFIEEKEHDPKGRPLLTENGFKM